MYRGLFHPTLSSKEAGRGEGVLNWTPQFPGPGAHSLSYRCKFPAHFSLFLLLEPEQKGAGKFDGNQPQDGRLAGSGPRSPPQSSWEPGTKATFLFGTGLKGSADAALATSPRPVSSAGNTQPPGGHTELKGSLGNQLLFLSSLR